MAARRRWRCGNRWRPRAFARTARLRRGDRRRGSPAVLGEHDAEDARHRRQAGRGAALWREPASIGRVLPHGRAALRRRHRDAGAGQGALLQQSQRHRRGLRAGRRVRSRRRARPSPSSSTPIRAAWRSARSLAEAYAKALACDPVSAFGGIVALNRTARRRGRARDRQDLHRGDHRARRERRGQGHSRREEESAAAAGRRAARPEGARASPSARSPAASSCSRATTAWLPKRDSRW